MTATRKLFAAVMLMAASVGAAHAEEAWRGKDAQGGFHLTDNQNLLPKSAQQVEHLGSPTRRDSARAALRGQMAACSAEAQARVTRHVLGQAVGTLSWQCTAIEKRQAAKEMARFHQMIGDAELAEDR